MHADVPLHVRVHVNLSYQPECGECRCRCWMPQKPTTHLMKHCAVLFIKHTTTTVRSTVPPPPPPPLTVIRLFAIHLCHDILPTINSNYGLSNNNKVPVGYGFLLTVDTWIERIRTQITLQRHLLLPPTASSAVHKHTVCSAPSFVTNTLSVLAQLTLWWSLQPRA